MQGLVDGAEERAHCLDSRVVRNIGENDGRLYSRRFVVRWKFVLEIKFQ